MQPPNSPPSKHHPVLPGSWLHPVKGSYRLKPLEQHSRFFQQRADLMGTDLVAAYADGWVSIRRWREGVWVVAYGRLADVRMMLASWAAEVVAEWPEEADVPVRAVTLFDGAPFAEAPLGALCHPYWPDRRP